MTGARTTSRRLTVASAGAALALAVAIAPAAQVRDPGAAPAAAGTGRIAGIVRHAADRKPARRVRVTLNPLARTVLARTVTTGDDGRFEFAGLPANRYRLQASKPGFIRTEHGEPRPDAEGSPIALGDGESVADIVLSLTRGAVVTGTVRDEQGRPLPDVAVSVLRWDYSSLTGEPMLSRESRSGSVTTDDRGVYRAWELPPGRYLIAATPNLSGARVGPSSLEDIRRTAPGDVDRALQVYGRGSGARAGAAMGGAGDRGATPDGAREPLENYAPTYYPGAIALAAAQTIRLQPADERTGLDIAVRFVPMARIRGRVSMPDGTIQRQIAVTLAPGGPDAPAVASIASRPPARLGADGSFTINSVAPGDYVLRARAVPAGTRGGPPPSDVPSAVWAEQTLRIDGADAEVTLTLQPAMTLPGRVVFAGTTEPPAIGNLTFYMVPRDAGAMLNAGPTTRVGERGTFEFAGVTPGEYRIIHTWAGTTSRGWGLQSAVLDGRNALDRPVVVRAGESGEWVMTFTDRPTSITGRFSDASGRPATAYTIIAFPADPSLWVPGSRYIRTVKPATDGTFSASGLRPGQYHLAALIDFEPGQWNDPAFLQSLVPASIRLTLHEGETTTQDIRVGG